jgi:hypothetical protein
MDQSTRSDWRLAGVAGSQAAGGAANPGISNRNQEVSRPDFIDRLSGFDG